MSDFASLLGMMQPHEKGFQMEATLDWLQGRTLYGGLSAALCLEATLRAFGDLPPLRSAHFTFAGPASGVLAIQPVVLRRGKSTVVVEVDLTGEVGPAVTASLIFGAARPSVLSYSDIQAPEVRSPEQNPGFFAVAGAPTFTRHFDMRQAGAQVPLSGAAVPEFLVWVRHKNAGGVDPTVALLALADAPPPAAMAMFAAPASISTMDWAVNFVGVPPSQGWHLIRTRGEAIAQGYASQRMTVWDAAGMPLVAALQNVAVFV